MIDMIKGISLQNFMSFDDIDLDMTDKGGKGMGHVLIYGENGSGKTNLIDSLMFLGRSSMTALCEQYGKGDDEPIRTRCISDLACQYRMIGAEGNMVLRYRIEIDGHDATYTLEFDDENRILSESLDYIVNKRRGNLFRIGRDGARIQKDLMTGGYRREIDELIERYWGRHTFIAILMNESRSKNESFFDSNVSGNIRSFLRYIGSMVVVKKNESYMPTHRTIRLPSGIIGSKDVADLDRVEASLSKFLNRLYSDIRSVHFMREDLDDGRLRYELYFDKRIAGRIRAIPADRESSGTRYLVGILPLLLFCADGKTVAIDEIDTGIHDLLISQLIGQCIPDITGQLIATTHNTSLMTSKDAPNIFIISIDRNGYKRIDSIQSTEPPNVKTNVQKRYMEGYYSGIPLVADIGLKDILRTSADKGS